jgi:hypothetical protein
MFILTLLLHWSPCEAQTTVPPSSSYDGAELSRRLDILADEIEKLKRGDDIEGQSPVKTGLGGSASKIYKRQKGVSVGGYGEMLYENYNSETESGSTVTKSDKIDFLRQVLYVGYRFNENTLFNSEIEVEHASTSGGVGEVSTEFAYVDRFFRPEFNIRIGLLIVPMGLINELHEPTLFLSARRPETETLIIPSTWRENGLGIFGDIGQFSYRLYLVNGLKSDSFTGSSLRSGRQKGANARADHFSTVARLDYVGANGLLAGVSAYLGPSTAATNGVPNAQTRILDAHFDWKFRAFELRALAAMAQLENVTELNQHLGFTGNKSVGTILRGHYLELGYDVFSGKGSEQHLVPFLRWEQYNTQSEVPLGFTTNGANAAVVLTYGISYKWIEQIVTKFDYQDFKKNDKSGIGQFNASLGFVF